jgi:hypothetical protein
MVHVSMHTHHTHACVSVWRVCVCVCARVEHLEVEGLGDGIAVGEYRPALRR